jgi:hypothetical protein
MFPFMRLCKSEEPVHDFGWFQLYNQNGIVKLELLSVLNVFLF